MDKIFCELKIKPTPENCYQLCSTLHASKYYDRVTKAMGFKAISPLLQSSSTKIGGEWFKLDAKTQLESQKKHSQQTLNKKKIANDYFDQEIVKKVDSRFINTSTSNILAQQSADATVNGNNDTNGQRIFVNLGNIDGGNVGDFTSGANAGGFTAAQLSSAEDEVYTSDGFLKSIMLVSIGSFTSVIERIADARSENGAEQSRLGMVDSLLMQNQTNLEAAHGRIMDADVALESSRFARQNVLVQSSAAMVAQANQLTNIALQLLG